MRSAWTGLLAHAHAVRITLLVVLIVGGTVWGWYLYQNGGFTENAPPAPQFIEVYVDTSANSAAVSAVSTITPVTSFGKERKPCGIESGGCDAAREYLTIQVTPKGTISAQGLSQTPSPLTWMVVTDTPPATHPRQWTKAPVSLTGRVPLTGFPKNGVWIHSGSIDDGKPVSFTTQFDLHIVARPSDHLVVEMPALLNEPNPQSWCGPELQVNFESSNVPPQVVPAEQSGGCAVAPGQPGFNVSTVLPFTGSIAYFSPQTARSTEVLADSSGLRGFTLDSSDGGTPIYSGFDWTGTYQLEPAIYATNISSTGTIARRQLILGILIGLVLAALLGLVGEFRHEKKEAPPSTSGAE